MSARRTVTDEQLVEMVRLMGEGVHADEIAERYRVSAKTVYRLVPGRRVGRGTKNGRRAQGREGVPVLIPDPIKVENYDDVPLGKWYAGGER